MNLEARTVAAMIHIYCRARHGAADGLCADCAGLLAYAEARIEKCPFGVDKPVCNKCTVHCYKPEMRDQIKEVMRFAGPRMMRRHPILAVRHLIRSKRYSGTRSK
jgi:hypothetical protein